ncbi:CLUMA_CG011508, isoform A [Clunio marinus]|uniref:CLUMA_CG011508, isoform A n=1 Tax=Clunio marinus TaxID=568069 RepID=A0A1J1IF09_9DIPT|nr:CLUMA_CG011508, isoform A [Clunio marinus]
MNFKSVNIILNTNNPQSESSLKAITSNVEPQSKDEDSKTNEKGNLELDLPPVPTNTPISSKSVGSNDGAEEIKRKYRNPFAKKYFKKSNIKKQDVITPQPFHQDPPHQTFVPQPHQQ